MRRPSVGKIGGEYILYLVQAKTLAHEWVKIGITTDIRNRVQGIACGCPVPIDVVWHRPIGRQSEADWAEKAIHAAMQDHWTSGEWFAIECDDALRERVDAIVSRYLPSAPWTSVRFDESPWRSRTNRAEKLSALAERRAVAIESARKERRAAPFKPTAPLTEMMSIYHPK